MLFLKILLTHFIRNRNVHLLSGTAPLELEWARIPLWSPIIFFKFKHQLLIPHAFLSWGQPKVMMHPSTQDGLRQRQGSGNRSANTTHQRPAV
jgi:hypothetical protein